MIVALTLATLAALATCGLIESGGRFGMWGG